MKKTAIKILSIFTVSAAFVLFVAGQVNAQDKVPLVVSPARNQIRLDPGEKGSFQLKFYNGGTSPVAGKLKVVDFIVTGVEGHPVLLENVDYPISNQYSGASWVTLPFDKGVIAPGEGLTVNYKVSVPEDALPGGRYVAIYFEATGGDLGTLNPVNEQISATAPRIVGLVYIRVNGPITESAYVDVFKTPVFLQFGPIPVTFDIFNKGNYHITPSGQVTLTNWFNKVIETKVLETKNIFPNAKREYKESLGSTWMFGRYKVDLTAAYGESGKVAEASSYVWVIPVTLIMAIILGVAVVVLALLLIMKKLRAKQTKLEEKLEKELTEVEELKNKFKDSMPKGKK